MRSSAVACALAALLVTCPAAAALEADRVWAGRDLASEVPIEAFDAYGAAIVDLGHDGPAFVAMNDNARTYVLDLLEGRVLAELSTRHAGDADHWWTRTLNGVAVGDMDVDGLVDLLVLNTGGYLTRFEHDAANDTLERVTFDHVWERFAYVPAHDDTFWERNPWYTPSDPAEATHLAHGHPYLAAPRVGVEPWVYVHSDDLPGAFAFDAEGALRWVVDWHDGHAGPWVGEVAPDTGLAVFATDSGEVVAHDPETGDTRWIFEVPAHVEPGAMSVAPVPLDVDRDGDLEFFAAARVAVDGEGDWMQRQHAYLFLLDHQGELLWSAQHPDGNPLVHSAAVPMDSDGDGDLELLVLDWNTIGRKPGNFERLGPGNLFALDARTGEILWTTPVDNPSTDHDFPVAAFDGTLSVIVPHSEGGVAGLATIRVSDGNRSSWAPLPEGWEPLRGAVAADLDRDGLLEIVQGLVRPASACIPKDDVPCREGGFAVYRSDAPVESLVASGAHTRSAVPPPIPPVQGPGVPAPGSGIPTGTDALGADDGTATLDDEPVSQKTDPERPAPLLPFAIALVLVAAACMAIVYVGRQRR